MFLLLPKLQFVFEKYSNGYERISALVRIPAVLPTDCDHELSISLIFSSVLSFIKWK